MIVEQVPVVEELFNSLAVEMKAMLAVDVTKGEQVNNEHGGTKHLRGALTKRGNAMLGYAFCANATHRISMWHQHESIHVAFILYITLRGVHTQTAGGGVS